VLLESAIDRAVSRKSTRTSIGAGMFPRRRLDDRAALAAGAFQWGGRRYAAAAPAVRCARRLLGA
jgi:hypothetical protein